ncbi:helix-turn-helix domain-containing protein [Roseomonas sp. GC11]|uniref:helix-turn-helix transcriptional regulator n=1 Tax=Roseomonas sp. GC11 TaxID=2950546 RepID=UPI00210C724C|nr:helix-turn-helix domain-containing protein [Roseomonas sp. GC11]MCQ4159217.1 helix-turn-helix domain-containing protein [Roseomonas sp. GC11]
MSRQHDIEAQRNGGLVRHLDQHDLANRWGLSIRTLERWRYLNQGPAFLKLGGRILYRLEDVEAFEAAQARDPAGAVQRPDTVVPAKATA